MIQAARIIGRVIATIRLFGASVGIVVAYGAIYIYITIYITIHELYLL